MFETVPPSPSAISAEDLTQATRLLEAVAEDSLILSRLSREDRLRFLVAAGRVSRPEKSEIRRRTKVLRRAKHQAAQAGDRAVRASTQIRGARIDSVFVPPPRMIEPPADGAGVPTRRLLSKPQDCYICKAEYAEVHAFYDSLCPRCAAFNYEKRFPQGSLAGRVALITGARLKIGYQAALMLLRAGAKVIVTTRFPKDAAFRYAQEADFRAWGSRLEIHGLDLRHSPSVEMFARFIEQRHDRLDFLINNAAQTVRRPPGFYRHLLEIEERPFQELPEAARLLLQGHEACKSLLTSASGASWVSEWHTAKALPAPGLACSAHLSQIPYSCDAIGVQGEGAAAFPAGRLDADLQQVDLRKMNSWRMTLADVPTDELLEVQLVNSIAPFILCSKLKPLMMRDRTDQKHIINVSAMEGKFNRHTKTDRHPHTNMAKAALNMMTLTSARDYALHGIFMNAVDTGWVTDEDPADLSARKQQVHDFQPPLDIVDGAARVVDPIFSGLQTGKHSWGNFLKDYVPTDW